MFKSEKKLKVSKPINKYIGFVSTEFYQSSPIDSFLLNECKSSLDGEMSVRITSDIYMLFNQQRLDKMTQSALLQHFDSQPINEPSMSALRSKLSDADLCKFIKSRYIQSPSELMAWTQFLMDNYDTELVRLQSLADVPVDTPKDDISPSSDN